jgi:hypothetical protein
MVPSVHVAKHEFCTDGNSHPCIKILREDMFVIPKIHCSHTAVRAQLRCALLPSSPFCDVREANAYCGQNLKLRWK